MALHEQAVGATDEWYTPAYVFLAMNVPFDTDPCASAKWTPSTSWCFRLLTVEGLERAWDGFVWMNPPFGPRNGIVPWLERFMEHANGVALVPDRTSAPWWREFAPKADLALFVSPKIRFIDACGREGTSPAQGTVLLAKGKMGCIALRNAARAGLGSLWKPINS